MYDASGNHIAKMFDGDTTVYVRDASSNVMSVYLRPASGELKQTEVHLYGSSRLGMQTKRSAEDSVDIILAEGFGKAKELIFTRGEKIFELSNHLGNVLATVSDHRIAVDDGNGEVAYYEADVVNANDYYPGGMLMPGRKFQVGSKPYRFGFQEQETDPELWGGAVSFKFRVEDP